MRVLAFLLGLSLLAGVAGAQDDNAQSPTAPGGGATDSPPVRRPPTVRPVVPQRSFVPLPSSDDGAAPAGTVAPVGDAAPAGPAALPNIGANGFPPTRRVPTAQPVVPRRAEQPPADDSAPADEAAPAGTGLTSPQRPTAAPSEVPAAGDESASPETSAPEPSGDSTEAPAASDADIVPAVTLESARINFSAIVQSYIARHRARGAWTIKDRKGRTWHLHRPKTLDDTVRNVGGALYAGQVLLRTASGAPHVLDLDFTVDFSGTDWRVRQYRLVKIDSKPLR